MTKSTGLRAPHLLLVEAPYYSHIAAMLREGAERAVAAEGATCESVSVPGAFEAHMPAIVEWFREHPPGEPAK